MVAYPREITYSDRLFDEKFEYRWVVLTREAANRAQSKMSRRTGNLLLERDWRESGITMSAGWMHFMIHPPETHVLLFRRPLGCDPKSGKPPEDWSPPTAERIEGPLPSHLKAMGRKHRVQ
ncbi:MAG: hypothetical protein KVP17_001796 [Porospora cf. gigantea B]|uniref:uncharacterized protein n=1 Tax=Porospora cf. gigantea B TaxID=2853592 RepID=UPI003571DF19|nr:MAG: hypothetical protein KVP17_001796 [Porospora cf. gigantea B]